jgi:predicted DNA-binding transcriptional regulator AlpA
MTTSGTTVQQALIPRRFLTERDLASMLSVSVKTIQGWRFRGQGPPWRKLGQGRTAAVRYNLAEVEAWIAEQPGGGKVLSDAA